MAVSKSFETRRVMLLSFGANSKEVKAKVSGVMQVERCISGSYKKRVGTVQAKVLPRSPLIKKISKFILLGAP